MSTQREIRFRAWDKVHREMVKVKTIDFDKDGRIEEVNTETYCHFPLHNDTVVLMQFTGLHDKNGKEIYEGDIVLYCWTGGFGDEFVQRKAIQFRVDLYGLECVHEEIGYRIETGVRAEKNRRGRYEVIGNVHENPELLTA